MDRTGGGWTGFSDEDLQQLKQTSTAGDTAGATRPLNARRGGQRPRPTSRAVTQQQAPPTGPLSANQRLSQPALEIECGQSHTSRVLSNKASKSEQSDVNGAAVDASRSRGGSDVGKVGGTEEKKGEGKTMANTSAAELPNEREAELVLLDEETILTREMISMDKFREHQKMMEEQNKKKKALLTVAINERQKKAKVEAVRLTHIKQEVDRLDQMVVSDVAIIRDKIEEVSRDYLEAQKRYARAEKEFIDAKLDLHRKLESKDALTEHLYTVIHQNELRKAKKLSQLMERLDMEDEAGVSAEDLSPPPMCLIAPAERKIGGAQSLGLPPGSSSGELSELSPLAAVETSGVEASLQQGASEDETAVKAETVIRGAEGAECCDGVVKPIESVNCVVLTET